jgi:hypothetical protein
MLLNLIKNMKFFAKTLVVATCITASLSQSNSISQETDFASIFQNDFKVVKEEPINWKITSSENSKVDELAFSPEPVIRVTRREPLIAKIRPIEIITPQPQITVTKHEPITSSITESISPIIITKKEPIITTITESRDPIIITRTENPIFPQINIVEYPTIFKKTIQTGDFQGFLKSQSNNQQKFLDHNSKKSGQFSGLSREKLQARALAAEKYHRSLTGRSILGGLHDRINSMSDEDLARYISKEQREHPELNLNEKVNEYGLLSEESQLKDLEHMLYRTDRLTLINYALATEAGHRIENKQTGLKGGLHDYVYTLSDDEIRQIIMAEATEHKSFNSFSKLQNLASSLGFDHIDA